MSDHTIVTVFRSTHPDVLAAWAEHEARWRAAGEALDALDEAIRPHPSCRLRVYDKTRTPANYSIGELNRNALPEGWRETKRYSGDLVPFRTKKAGKAIAKQWDAVRRVPDLVLPGMVAHSFIGLRWCSPGAMHHDGVVWCMWTLHEDDITKSEQFDGTMWQVAKRSEYFAAVEARDAVKP